MSLQATEARLIVGDQVDAMKCEGWGGGGGGGGGGGYIWGELMSLQATMARLIVGDQVDAKHEV